MHITPSAQTHRRLVALLVALACGLWLPGCIAVSKDAYERDMKGMRQQQDWLEAQKKKLAADMNAALAAQKSTAETLATCAKERDDLKGELVSTQAKLKRIAESCGKAGKLLAECEDGVNDYKFQVAQLKDKNAKLASRMQAIQEQLDALMASINRVRQRLAAMVAAGKLSVVVKDGFLVIQLQSDILFDSSKATLKDAAKPVLRELGEVLKSFAGRRFQVAGHTDPRGGDDINWSLSTERSVSVVQFLIKQGGVPPEMLSAGGYASYLPVADNDTDTGMRQNRRVEFLLLPDLSELLELAGLKAAPKAEVKPATE